MLPMPCHHELWALRSQMVKYHGIVWREDESHCRRAGKRMGFEVRLNAKRRINHRPDVIDACRERYERASNEVAPHTAPNLHYPRLA